MTTSPGRLAKWWLDRPLRAKGLAVLAPPALVLVFTVAASFIAERYQVALRQTFNSANSTAFQSAQVLTLLLDAETSVRGYALTGDVSFLQPYRQAVSELPADLAQLTRSSSNGSAGGGAYAVASLASQQLANLARIENGVAAHDLPPPAMASALADGKQVMDELRADLGAIQARETATLDSKGHAIGTLQTVVQFVEVGGLLVGVLGGVTAMVLFVRSVVRRIGEVGANAQRLGVSEPLLPVTPASDEIGQLAEELDAASTLLTQRSIDVVRAHITAIEAVADADQLLSRVSHELRTPLTAVLGFGHLIDRSRLSEQDAEAVEQILHGGRHMLRIIEEGRTPVHIRQAITLELQPVDVGRLVREVRNLLQPLSARRGLTVVGCESTAGVVIADYHRFKQVLINLLSNAVKYNRPAGTITVACQQSDDGYFRVAVTDTGEGIPAELIERVFVPFDRLGAEGRGVQGTGIGLSLSKTFVEAMGGVIGLESAVGHGSTFWVDLPESPRPAALVTEPTA